MERRPEVCQTEITCTQTHFQQVDEGHLCPVVFRQVALPEDLLPRHDAAELPLRWPGRPDESPCACHLVTGPQQLTSRKGLCPAMDSFANPLLVQILIRESKQPSKCCPLLTWTKGRVA